MEVKNEKQKQRKGIKPWGVLTHYEMDNYSTALKYGKCRDYTGFNSRYF